MATGYEARQGGRASFASDGVAPVQTTTGASGESRGAQLVGGESIGGVEGGQYTQPGYVAGGLGQFFERFMEPAIQRKQQEQFFKGYTEAQSGRALDELTSNDSPLTKIFGPSGFAQGAQFYAAQAKIDEWSQGTLADIDNLKRLTPSELGKHMAASSEAMMTGDPYADQQIQAGILQAQGALIQTISKASYKWGQQDAVEQQSRAMSSAASSLQQVAQVQAGLGEDAQDMEAVTLAGQRFLGLMAKPEGMADETYQEGLYNFMRKAMTDGNFYAVELMNAHHVSDVLTDAQQEKLWTSYDRYGSRLLDRAASDPEVMDRITKLDIAVKTEQLSAAGAQQGLRGINRMLRDRTGIQRDYFTPDDIRSSGGKVIDAILARQRREEQHAWELQRDAANRQADDDEKAAEAQAEVDRARAVWGTGQIAAGVAGGAKETNFNTIAMEEYSHGDLGGITRAYRESSWSSTGVKSQVQSLARTGLGEKYTKSTQQAYEVWQKFTKANPAMAKEYFAEYDLPFTNFDRMVRGGIDPTAAYLSAFAKPGGYGKESIPPERRKAFDAALDGIVGSTEFSWLSPTSWGNWSSSPTETTKQALRSAMSDDFARYSENSDRDTVTLAQQVYTNLLKSGRWEQYGSIGWSNSRPGKSLGSTLGLQDKDAGEVMTSTMTEALKAIGVDTLEGVKVFRTGNDLLLESVQEGKTKFVPVTFGELRKAADQHVKGKLIDVYNDHAVDRHSEAARVAYQHIYRRIPGEKPWQRIKRMNVEVSQWERANPISKFEVK